MKSEKRAGIALLVISIVLLCLQFGLTFGTSVVPRDGGISTLLLHLTPYTLLLISLYVVFAKTTLPISSNKIARWVIVVAACYGVAGGAFLLLLVIGLLSVGPKAIDVLFSHLPLLLVLGTLFALPFIYKYLR